MATGYLERFCDRDGKFVYQVDTLSGQQSSSYNILRHSGAIYSLSMLRGAQRDALSDAALSKAAAYLKSYIAPGLEPDQLAVWSKPTPDKSKADLGATGLGIVALVEGRKAEAQSFSLEDLQSLGRFLLFLQKDDGSFIHRFNLQSGGEPNWRSLYYPGEAALGLISLYEVDHSPQWLNAAAKALGYLAKSRAGSPEVPPDHWALIATAKLLPYCAGGSCPVSRDELIRHAEQICNELLSEQQIQPDNPARDGALDEDGRIAPAAISVEGLLAAMEFLPPEDADLRAKIMAAATRSVAFLLRTQITSGPYAGGMPRAYVSGTPTKVSVRIDYVQHSMSSWIRYKELINQH